jgi:nitrite reductase (NADH) small subunit
MWQKVASTKDFSETNTKVVTINNFKIALFKTKDGFYAIENDCPHRGGPLGEGHLEGDVVICPWHAWSFEVKTGKCHTFPDDAPLKSFPIKVDGEDLLLDA